jgi:hypothetical protein
MISTVKARKVTRVCRISRVYRVIAFSNVGGLGRITFGRVRRVSRITATSDVSVVFYLANPGGFSPLCRLK